MLGDKRNLTLDVKETFEEDRTLRLMMKLVSL